MYTIRKKSKRFNVFLLIIIFLLSSALSVSNACDKEDKCKNSKDYWPTYNWRTSTPEEQGMDSEKLLNMFETIQRDKTPIHSVLVIRNGYIVSEAYFDPYDMTVGHSMYSATKSVTSTLIGIAIEEGYIKSVKQKVLDFFPGVHIENDQYQIKDMTIENLLTMSAGHEEDSSGSVFFSTNWPETFFSLPFNSKPGTKFLYDSGISHLLSAIITKATGMSTEAYAKKHLFDPMNITKYTWETDLNSMTTGGWGLKLTPRDAAKFGYLALQKGKWSKKQLVTKEWMDLATQKHIEGWWVEEKGDDYGYHWWMNSFGGYRADGYGGQFVFVVPEQDLVVVFTSGINYTEARQPDKYVSDFIIPSIKTSKPLHPNPKSVSKLAELIKNIESPKPKKVESLPLLAKQISGKTYIMDSGNMSVSLEFKKGNTCTLKMNQNGKDFILPIGLDDVYRTTKASKVGSMIIYPYYDTIALKGHWSNDNTFIINWHYVGEPYSEVYQFTFEGKSMSADITEYLQDSTYMTPIHQVLNGTYN